MTTVIIDTIEEFESFISSLHSQTSVKAAKIGIPITKEQMVGLANALAANTSLKSLNLSNNHIDSSTPIESYISTTFSIKPQGLQAIANALKNNTSLEGLDLSSNGIGNGGIRHLTDALEGNKTLQQLDLSNNLSNLW